MKGKNALNLLAQAPAMIWPEFIVLIALTSLADCALLTAHPVVLSHSYLPHITVTGFGSWIFFAWTAYTRSSSHSREITRITNNQLQLTVLLVKVREN